MRPTVAYIIFFVLGMLVNYFLLSFLTLPPSIILESSEDMSFFHKPHASFNSDTNTFTVLYFTKKEDNFIDRHPKINPLPNTTIISKIVELQNNSSNNNNKQEKKHYFDVKYGYNYSHEGFTSKVFRESKDKLTDIYFPKADYDILYPIF